LAEQLEIANLLGQARFFTKLSVNAILRVTLSSSQAKNYTFIVIELMRIKISCPNMATPSN